MLASNFLKPMKDKSQIQEALETTSITSIKRNIPRYIVVNHLKIKRQGKKS